MHQASEFGLAAIGAIKQKDKPDGQAGWIRDLIEILDTAHDAEEVLEHTRMAMYQDRIFAFTPKGAFATIAQGRDFRWTLPMPCTPTSAIAPWGQR